MLTQEEQNAIVYEYERKGREKFSRLCEMKNLQYWDNPIITEHYDGIVYHRGKPYVVEIKDRDVKYEPFDTYLFENDKYVNLNKAIEETGAYGAFYVNFFEDRAYVFNATTTEIADIKTVWRWCNEHTAFGDKKVWKEVKLIPKELSKKYTLQ